MFWFFIYIMFQGYWFEYNFLVIIIILLLAVPALLCCTPEAPRHAEPCRADVHNSTLSLPAYHCRQWNSWHIYASPVAKGLTEYYSFLWLFTFMVTQYTLDRN